MNGILAGKKTYVAAGFGALSFILGYFTGDFSTAEAVQGVLTSVLGATLRSGLNTRK